MKNTNSTQIPGIGKKMAQHLISAGYPTIESLKGQNPEEIYTKHRLIQGVGKYVMPVCTVLLPGWRFTMPTMMGNCRPTNKIGAIGRTDMTQYLIHGYYPS